MPITDVISNDQALTLTIIGDYPVPVSRLWDAYADPRQLEKFWGPKEWPATFTRHDMAVGGESHYYMTGPDGTKSNGWFRYLSVTPYEGFEVQDGFSDDEGKPNHDMPSMRIRFSFAPTDTGSRFESVTQFTSVESMQQLINMGMMEGMRSAMGQLDGVLTDLRTWSADLMTNAQVLNDTQIRVSRVINGTVQQVWRAHHEPTLMQKWMLGPDGWTMPVCEVARNVGDSYRYEWQSNDGTQRFGFEGELLESASPHREVTSERMIGTGGPSTRNELTLTQMDAGTLTSVVITYPTIEMRDMILGTGMVNGMEASYKRLEEELLPLVPATT